MRYRPFFIPITLFCIIIGFFVGGWSWQKNIGHPTESFADRESIINNESQNNTTLETENAVQHFLEQDISIHNQIISSHQKIPNSVRAVYMSSWIASNKKERNRIVNLIENSKNLNAVVIDIKDATGRVSFLVDDPVVKNTGSPENRIADIKDFISELHEKNIYVIGRISVFQDPYLAKKYPDWAIQSKTTGQPWKDRKGLSFLDPINQSVREYTIALARASHTIGFDEINFDYIRFPSDGNMKDIQYPENFGSRADIMEEFFKQLDSAMSASNIITSADLFGLTTEAIDDMGIGQVLEKALPYFDFIAPMIYPSHYAKGYNGFENPAAHPYKVVLSAMTSGIRRAEKLGFGPEKFRPWIQDFNMGAPYGEQQILDQITALTELGITGYMVWDPANRYTISAY